MKMLMRRKNVERRVIKLKILFQHVLYVEGIINRENLKGFFKNSFLEANRLVSKNFFLFGEIFFGVYTG